MTEKAKMELGYSGTRYLFTGAPLVRCPDCGHLRNSMQVHAVEGGRSCVFCIRKDLPAPTRSVVPWGPMR